MLIWRFQEFLCQSNEKPTKATKATIQINLIAVKWGKITRPHKKNMHEISIMASISDFD